jgi:2-desacetyl-2-hydroxyethyl bacteriochlorophyllide A dehydrogenase
MRAVVFVEPGRVEVADVAEPVLEGPRDAIVRVTRAAICGTDLHLFHGKVPMERGETLGHEAVGVVEEVGEGVARVRPGDRVVLSYVTACGSCWFCARGETSLCDDSKVFGAGAFGGGLAGAQAERVRVPVADVNLFAVPDAIDDDCAVFLGDAAPTGVAAASMAAPAPGEVTAVIGAGPVGHLATQALIGAGAERVVVLDREPSRLALVREAGAEVIDVRERDPEMALAAITEDRGADVVIEAVGSAEAFASALDVVRRGGRIVVAGVFAGEVVDLQLGVWWARGLQVRFLGQCSAHAWWEASRDAMLAGTMDPTALVSHRLPLEEAATGYDLFDRREASKVLLAP